MRAGTLPLPRETHRLLQSVASPEQSVRVWQAHLDSASVSEIEELRQLLDVTESKRADRFYFERDRGRFLVTRGLLRHLLSRTLEHSTIEFKYGVNGKPELARENNLQFNLSHSADLAVFALAWKRQVGIDLESAESFVRNPADLPGLAERIFSERELAAWRALPASESNTAAFLRGWTRKEACLKAAGLRLDDMASIETGFDQVSAPGEILISSVEPSATIRLKIYDLPLLAAQAPAACALAVETN